MEDLRAVTIGDALLELCAAARTEVVLVAPFIKRGVLERLLDAVDPAVPVRCITRWIPDEIIAGVSDLEVWPLLRERGRGFLGLRGDLHAKYYRGDDRCLVGSANLTGLALGWRTPCNLELSLLLPAQTPPLPSFESSLIESMFEVDDEIHREYVVAVERLKELLRPLPGWGAPEPATDDAEDRSPIPMQHWVPTLRNPTLLFDAYTGAFDRLTRAAREDGRRDLAGFVLPNGLTREAFEVNVRLQLLQKPIVRALDRFIDTPRRFGALRRFLVEQPCAREERFDATELGQTLMRWLLYFMPDRYLTQTPRYSEVLLRRE